MFKPIFTTIFKRRDVAIFLAFSSLPLLLALARGAGVSLSVKSEAMDSALAYTVAILDLQTNIFLPMLIFAFVVASVFREDIDTGRLFLFKDLPKNKIFTAKMLGLFAIYAVYVGLTILLSLLSYFLFLGGNSFLPAGLEVLKQVLQLLVILGLNLTAITAIAYLSLHKKTLFAVLAGLFIYMFILAMPVWFGLQYLAPGYYVQQLAPGTIWFPILMTILLLTLYILPIYLLAAKSFRDIQF